MQSSHATIELVRSGLLDPSLPHPHLVVFGIRDEKELLKIPIKLDQLKIKYTSFIEPDRNFETTAIVTEPIFGEDRNLFRKFQLLKGDCHVCNQIS